MPAIPASTRSSITLRLLLHAKEHWPQLGRLQVTYRGGFAYAAAIPPGDDEPQPLFRLRYGGSAHSFGFAVYSSATSRYEDTVLLTGSPVGTPQEAWHRYRGRHRLDSLRAAAADRRPGHHGGKGPCHRGAGRAR